MSLSAIPPANETGNLNWHPLPNVFHARNVPIQTTTSQRQVVFLEAEIKELFILSTPLYYYLKSDINYFTDHLCYFHKV